MVVAWLVLRKASTSKTELARNVDPGRRTSLATPLAKKRALPRIFEVVAWKVMAWNMWSCRLSPTGRSETTSMPWSLRCWACPTPESIRICADPTKPAARMTSLPARMVRSEPSLSRTRTPVARPFSMITLVTSTRVWTSRVGGARWWM